MLFVQFCFIRSLDQRNFCRVDFFRVGGRCTTFEVSISKAVDIFLKYIGAFPQTVHMCDIAPGSTYQVNFIFIRVPSGVKFSLLKTLYFPKLGTNGGIFT